MLCIKQVSFIMTLVIILAGVTIVFHQKATSDSTPCSCRAGIHTLRSHLTLSLHISLLALRLQSRSYPSRDVIRTRILSLRSSFDYYHC